MKRATILAPVVGLGVALTILVASAAANPGATVAQAELGPYTTPHAGVVIDAGVTARAQAVSEPSGQASLSVTAEGLAPGASYAVHVHYGACTDYLGHYQYEHPGPGSRENEIWLDLTANADGRASEHVRVPAFDLDQPLSLVIHQHANPDVETGSVPGPRIACGNLEQNQ